MTESMPTAPAPRIAFVVATTSGGTGRHVRMLARGVAERGGRAAVLGPAAAREVAVPSGTNGVEVDIADRPRPGRDAAALLVLRRALTGRNRPDLVHAHGMRAGALCALALAGSPGAPPLLVTLHNAPPSGRSAAVYLALETVVARRADRVLCVSPDLVSRMRRCRARDVQLAVVPAPPPGRPAADPVRTRAALGVGDRPLLVVGARLAEQKGLPDLLDAVVRWADRSPAPLTVVAGDGPMRAGLAGRIDAERLPVRLLGTRSDLPDLLAAADVVVVPSRWEGQPLIVQEALHAGAPLVATAVGGLPALVGDAAVLVPPADGAALADAVAGLLDDPARAARYAAAARDRATTLPTERDAVDAAWRGYRELIAGHR